MELKLYLLSLIALLGAGYSKLLPFDVVPALAIVFILLAFQETKTSKKVKAYHYYVVFAFFLVITPFYRLTPSLSTLYFGASKYVYDGFGGFIKLSGYVFFTVAVAISTFRSKKIFFYIPLALIAGSVIVSFTNIIEGIYGVRLVGEEDAHEIIMDDLTRVRGLFGDPNASAGMIITGIISCVFLFTVTKKNIYRLLLALCAGYLLLGQSYTFSRTGAVSLVVGLFITTYSIQSKMQRKIFRCFFLILLIFGFGYMIGGREMAFGASASGNSRLTLGALAFEELKQNPLFGNGYAYGYHNNLLDIMVSGGLNLLFWYILFSWRIIVSKYKKKDYYLLALFVAMTVTGLGISWTNNVIFWLAVGLSLNSSLNFSDIDIGTRKKRELLKSQITTR